MLATSGIGDAGSLRKAREESHGLGLFVRSLVGLDREAAKQAFAGPDGLFTSPQLDALLAVLDQVRAAALAA